MDKRQPQTELTHWVKKNLLKIDLFPDEQHREQEYAFQM